MGIFLKLQEGMGYRVTCWPLWLYVFCFNVKLFLLYVSFTGRFNFARTAAQLGVGAVVGAAGNT